MKLNTVFDSDDEVTFLYSWFLRRDKKPIDNFIFYINYRVTCLLYLSACLISTIAMYIMDPIDCITDSSVDDIIDNFCLYQSTYTITNFSALEDERLQQPPHPGVPTPLDDLSEVTYKYHNYYLWVAPFLAIQAATFYIPRGVWKSLEGSRITTILNERNFLTNFDSSKVVLDRVVSFLASTAHRSYSLKLFFCEVLNLVNAVVQIYCMNVFLGYEFSEMNKYWKNLLLGSSTPDKPEAADLMFPKVTVCKFTSFGPTGNRVSRDALCVLSVNVINEKLFAILFIWIAAVLIPLSILALGYRLYSFLFQKQLLKAHLLPEMAISMDKDLNHLKKRLTFGNWQVLIGVGWIVDSWTFTEIVKSLLDFTKIN